MECARIGRGWGGEDWFRLGDRDLGLDLVRTQALREGVPLTDDDGELAARVGLASAARPGDGRSASDTRRWHQPAASRSRSGSSGVGHEDEVEARSSTRARTAARAVPGLVAALAAADAVLFAPSNPYLSIGPILAVRGIRDAIASTTGPLRRGEPARRGRGGRRDRRAVCSRAWQAGRRRHTSRGVYGELVDELVVDESDADDGFPVASTRMSDEASERRLAEAVLEVACA